MVARGPSGLAAELDEFRAQFEQISADADTLVAPLSDEQFAWQRAPDAWSVSQCLDHLNATARQYLPVMDDGIAEAIRRGLYGAGPYSYNWIGRLMVHIVQPTTRLRASAPKAFRPEPGRSRHDVTAAFRAYQVQYVDRLHQANGLDLAGFTGTHRIAGGALGSDAARVGVRTGPGSRASPPRAGATCALRRGIPALTGDHVKLQVLSIIGEGRGTQLCPATVDALFAVSRRNDANLSVHKTAGVRRAIERADATLWYLPPV